MRAATARCIVVPLSLLLLSACSSGSETPKESESGSVQAAAEALATGISAGDLSDVPLSGDGNAQKWWDGLVADMGDLRPEVTVGKVQDSSGGKAAHAQLHYSWTIGGRSWTYATTASLARAGQEWVVDRDPALLESSLTAGEVLDLDKETAVRADILGAGGVRLVTDRPVRRLGIDKTTLGGADPATSARRLARLLDIDAKSYVNRVRASGDKAFVEGLVLRAGDVGARVTQGVRQIPGAVALKSTMPLAPTREFARPVLGTVGPVTAEVVAESDGAYRPGDLAGLSGLEKRYDERLRGKPGLVVRAVDAKAGTERDLFTIDGKRGEPLRTTLVERDQSAAEEILADVGPASALVAIRPSDGAVLAVASGPGGNGYSTATVGTYAPGSTFKVVSSLALLRAGLHPSSPVQCRPVEVVDGKRFKNYDDYPAARLGRIDLRTAVANSCNTAFISQRDTVSQSDLVEAAAALGLGEDHDTGFPSYFGAIPSDTTETGHAAAMIGQGQVLASPLTMATVAASVAKGSTVVPRLVEGVTAKADPDAPLTGAEARELRDLMRAVVTEGSGSFLLDLPGAPVLAKTGTAEFGDNVPPETHAWMIAVHGDLAVAAFVDVGDSGSGTAGPLLEEFLRRAG